MRKALAFVIPAPSSSKNRRQLARTKSGRMRSFTSKQAERSKEQIVSAARNAIATFSPEAVGLEPYFGDARVEVIIEHDVASDQCFVTINEISRVRYDTRRDLQNLPEAICDALQGIVFDNDNQIDKMFLRRCIK